ncbi:uncharacterized protein [Linepithema humile]|uniref:uncharacterized protein n=1 Tax=Linepithema humile TaxID=83485 RepID=UPI00351DCEE0
MSEKEAVSLERRSLVDELHAPARRNFTRRPVVVKGYDDLWQADIVEMRPYSRSNGGCNYILTVIDVLSKYAWAIPLKTKGGIKTSKAFSAIFRERIPKNLQTDHGKEFYNRDFQNLVKKHGINHYSTYSVIKALVVERFNRTLKNEMWKFFTLTGSYRWIDDLPRLVSEYNGRKHRTIGMRPIDVTPEIAKGLLSTVYGNIKIASPAKFRIATVQRTNPVTYLIKDYRGDPVAGGFYEHELLKTAQPDVYLVEKVLRRKDDNVFVKWLGFDNLHNSWINKDDVL